MGFKSFPNLVIVCILGWAMAMTTFDALNDEEGKFTETENLIPFVVTPCLAYLILVGKDNSKISSAKIMKKDNLSEEYKIVSRGIKDSLKDII